jgi:hypothetical protein
MRKGLIIAIALATIFGLATAAAPAKKTTTTPAPAASAPHSNVKASDGSDLSDDQKKAIYQAAQGNYGGDLETTQSAHGKTVRGSKDTVSQTASDSDGGSTYESGGGKSGHKWHSSSWSQESSSWSVEHQVIVAEYHTDITDQNYGSHGIGNCANFFLESAFNMAKPQGTAAAWYINNCKIYSLTKETYVRAQDINWANPNSHVYFYSSWACISNGQWKIYFPQSCSWKQGRFVGKKMIPYKPTPQVAGPEPAGPVEEFVEAVETVETVEFIEAYTPTPTPAPKVEEEWCSELDFYVKPLSQDNPFYQTPPQPQPVESIPEFVEGHIITKPDGTQVVVDENGQTLRVIEHEHYETTTIEGVVVPIVPPGPSHYELSSEENIIVRPDGTQVIVTATGEPISVIEHETTEFAGRVVPIIPTTVDNYVPPQCHTVVIEPDGTPVVFNAQGIPVSVIEQEYISPVEHCLDSTTTPLPGTTTQVIQYPDGTTTYTTTTVEVVSPVPEKVVDRPQPIAQPTSVPTTSSQPHCSTQYALTQNVISEHGSSVFHYHSNSENGEIAYVYRSNYGLNTDDYDEVDDVSYDYVFNNGKIDSNYSAVSNITDGDDNYVNGCEGWWNSEGIDLTDENCIDKQWFLENCFVFDPLTNTNYKASSINFKTLRGQALMYGEWLCSSGTQDWQFNYDTCKWVNVQSAESAPSLLVKLQPRKEGTQSSLNA